MRLSCFGAEDNHLKMYQMLKVLYRISDRGNTKDKLPNATKKRCLENALRAFGSEHIFVFADNCEIETISMIRDLGVEPTVLSLGNTKSWRHIVEFAIERFTEDQPVYFLEDDYFHTPSPAPVILEGLAISEYVTLYDHPDKYLDPSSGGPNPYIRGGGESTRVYLTKATHWKETNSTTMTFATTVKIINEDKEIWWKFTSHPQPNDFGAFRRLLSKRIWETRKPRKLISALPGLATHAETQWLSPLFDWTKM